MATTSRPPSPSPSQLPPIPASPSYSYASTANPISSFNLPLPPPPKSAHAVLTKTDLELSQAAYSELLKTAKAYRQALSALSTAASNFGSALERCARLKEARSEAVHTSSAGGSSMANSFVAARGSCTAASLLSASGVHQLIANHQGILSETVYRSFEVPLLHDVDGWRRRMEEEEVTYQTEAKRQAKVIHKMEKEGMMLHKQRKRDVGKFRSHLVDLTLKLDGLTTLHGEHSRTLLRESQEVSVKIVESSSSLVRAEVDIFEALARKGWTGGGLDDLLEKGVDLFSSEPETHQSDTDKLFSILPSKSILADSSGEHSASRKHMKTDSIGKTDSLSVEGERYQSLAGAINERADDVVSIWSERGMDHGILNRSRGVRPWSPSPVRAVETEDISKIVSKKASKVEENIKEVEPKEIAPPQEPEPSTRDQSRGREHRRWSVTDDGTFSEDSLPPVPLINRRHTSLDLRIQLLSQNLSLYIGTSKNLLSLWRPDSWRFPLKTSDMCDEFVMQEFGDPLRSSTVLNREIERSKEMQGN